jgi:hypothetical protein
MVLVEGAEWAILSKFMRYNVYDTQRILVWPLEWIYCNWIQPFIQPWFIELKY